MNKGDFRRFARLEYADFRRMATEPGLSMYEKIGFPDSYRAGFEQAIYADIRCKLSPLGTRGATVVDIGPGCSELPTQLIRDCATLDQNLYMVDCPEMLALLPDAPGLHKVAGAFPEGAASLEALSGRVDAVLAYSVLQCIHGAQDRVRFLRAIMRLLAPGGRALIGDIANDSMRARFFSSDAGKAHHRRFTGRDEDPPAADTSPRPGKIVDLTLLELVKVARESGLHAYLLPQPPELPMHNRREDMLIVRP